MFRLDTFWPLLPIRTTHRGSVRPPSSTVRSWRPLGETSASSSLFYPNLRGWVRVGALYQVKRTLKVVSEVGTFTLVSKTFFLQDEAGGGKIGKKRWFWVYLGTPRAR